MSSLINNKFYNLIFGAHNNLLSINNSKLFAGIMMLILNIGSKYITFSFSKTQEEFIKNTIAREILVFSIVWMATKDIYVSILMTAAFVILADYVFNENSRLCLLPDKFKNLKFAIDENSDGIITDEEIKKAEKLLETAKKQKNKLGQLEMLSYMNGNLFNL
jgi:hypothetical protein